MAAEIRHNLGPAGASRTYWAELYDSAKNVWDTSTNTFRDESLVTAAHRAIVLSDTANVGKYWGDLPEVPPSRGYQWFVRRQAGGSPVLSDVIELVGPVFDFDGNLWGAPASIATAGSNSATVDQERLITIVNRNITVSPG